jgi:phage terminase large subunit GpA-like protein
MQTQQRPAGFLRVAKAKAKPKGKGKAKKPARKAGTVSPVSWAEPDLYAEAMSYLRRDNKTVLEYARTIELPDGDLAGTLYDPDVHPIQGTILRRIDGGASWVSILKPVQDGGSLASFVPILRRAHMLAQNVIVAYPTMDSAKDAWTKKVWPMLERQGGTQPRSGGGSRGGAARVVNLPAGGSIILRAAGGRGESGQASVTADAMLVDEVDDWADLRVLRLMERRLSRSRDPLIIYVSTCKRDALDGVEQSRIVRLYEQGSQTRHHYPCPHCGSLFPFDLAVLDHERRCIVCPHCKGEINEAQRLTMIRQFQVVDGAESHKFSIKWTALESPFPMLVDGRKVSVIEGLCSEYEAATDSAARGDHGLIRQYYRDRWCQPYRADLDETAEGATIVPTRARLAALSAVSDLPLAAEDSGQDTSHWCHVPAWVESITVGADIQQGGDKAAALAYWTAYGRGAGRGALLAWGTVLLSEIGSQPSEGEVHAGLDRLDSYMRGWGSIHGIPIVARGVDVGNGNHTAWLLRWLASHRHWCAVKGTSAMKPQPQDRPGWIYPRPQPGYILRLIETESVTRIVHGELLAKAQPPALQLPGGLPKEATIFRHICAVVEILPGYWTTRREGVHNGTPWKHPEYSQRNDYCDALVYARALSYEHETRPRQSPVAAGSVNPQAYLARILQQQGRR